MEFRNGLGISLQAKGFAVFLVPTLNNIGVHISGLISVLIAQAFLCCKHEHQPVLGSSSGVPEKASGEEASTAEFESAAAAGA